MYRRLLLEVEESPLLPGALHTKVVLLPRLPLAPPPAGMFIKRGKSTITPPPAARYCAW